MDDTPRAAALRLPTEPYPGLRPFLDHEAALLLGRGRQVREIIARLRETRFVAVIGGSGSGKSSLIRAGVVPELRGFGIAEAGDYWIPVVCTPGTTLPPDPGVPDAPKAQTPVTRLAWKFSQLLTPTGSADDDAARRAEIAAVFRQEAGFSRLVDAYFDELPAHGPDGKDARFLFVIDQFEELFHPNNRDNADAKQLVEAIIDHFFNPNPRCYVVLTMRSEHLADCASHLELPDAINKSSYLVRRLDERELREAIVGPSKVYLRLLQRRGAAPGETLPDDVVFDDAVIERLLADVDRITSDADHLPLLQHVLARTWGAACTREGIAADRVPARVTWPDLEQAVAPGCEAGWLRANEAVNSLRRSLENQAEAIYQHRSTDERVLIDVVLRHLAFKDPNNGQYSQQRVDVDDPRLFTGIVQPREPLRCLLDHGFLDTVNYLFWDKENPERVTLKVSHESFIRGWAHFRALVDAEAERFDEFVAVLRKCVLWSERPDYLLEASELARLDAYGLTAVFTDPVERRDWFRVLLQYRDGERLSRAEPQIDGFIAASRARQRAIEDERLAVVEQKREAAERDRINAEREREFEVQRRQDEADKRRILAEKERAEAEVRAEKATAARRNLLRHVLLAGVVGLAMVLVGLTVLWWAENDLAKKERTLHRSYALAAETQVGFMSQFSGPQGAQTPLYTTLLGASLFDEGQGSSAGPAQWPLLKLMYANRLDGVLRTTLLSEVRNAATLGTVLRGAAWAVQKPDGASGAVNAERVVACEALAVDAPGRSIDPRGARFFGRPGSTNARGLIVVGANTGVTLYAGHLQADGRECRIEDQLLSTPLEATRLSLAADLSNVVVDFASYRQFYSVLWLDSNGVQLRQRAVVTRPAGDTDDAAPGGIIPSSVDLLPATARAFATDLTLGKSTVRLFDLEPVTIATAGALRAVPMTLAVAATPCGEFARASSDAIQFSENDSLLETVVTGPAGRVAYCLHLKTASYRSPRGIAPTLATLYRVRDGIDAHEIESQTPLFSELVLGATRPDEVRIDTDAGWLAFRNNSSTSRRWRAVPWGLPAWRELARGVFDPQHTPAAEGMFNLIVGGEDVPDVRAAVAQPPARTLPVKTFSEPR